VASLARGASRRRNEGQRAGQRRGGRTRAAGGTTLFRVGRYRRFCNIVKTPLSTKFVDFRRSAADPVPAGTGGRWSEPKTRGSGLGPGTRGAGQVTTEAGPKTGSNKSSPPRRGRWQCRTRSREANSWANSRGERQKRQTINDHCAVASAHLLTYFENGLARRTGGMVRSRKGFPDITGWPHHLVC